MIIWIGINRYMTKYQPLARMFLVFFFTLFVWYRYITN